MKLFGLIVFGFALFCVGIQDAHCIALKSVSKASWKAYTCSKCK